MSAIAVIKRQTCAFRGNVHLSTVLLQFAIANTAASYDELKASFAAHLRGWAEPAIPTWRKTWGPEAHLFDVCVAGWSETNGPDAFVISNMDHPGVAPFVVYPIEGALVTPTNAEIDAYVQGIDVLDADCDGVAILELQRAYREPAWPWCRVGAFAQLTTVEMDRITTRIIHRWPDRIGERLAS